MGFESGLSHNDHHACRTSNRATVTQLDGLFSAYEDFAALMELSAAIVDFTKVGGGTKLHPVLVIFCQAFLHIETDRQLFQSTHRQPCRPTDAAVLKAISAFHAKLHFNKLVAFCLPKRLLQKEPIRRTTHQIRARIYVFLNGDGNWLRFQSNFNGIQNIGAYFVSR